MNSAAAPESRIHYAVAQYSRSNPDAIALISSGHPISYRELDTAANFYAAELKRRGVSSGQIIGVLMQRSPQLIALELGIMKCGAAYANLDSRWPAERLTSILRQLSSAIVVAADSVDVGCFPVYRPPLEDLATVAAEGWTFSPAVIDDRAPAVVFFTSGTSGKPKGILSSHRAVTRFFRPGGLGGFGPGHVMPQAAALPWDMCAFELWGQLSTGGTCALIGSDHLLPNDVRELVTGAAADVMWLTTSLFNVLVDEDLGCFEGLQRIYVGGEALSPAHVLSFLRRHPGILLQNGYGPAESCMLTTTHIITEDDCALADGIPLGRAVSGTEVFLLDMEGRRCPTDSFGEICIAGDGLAVGYLHDPGLTAEKFPVVFIDGKHVRIYRTGDMGVIDHAGVLHFRGRNDQQIKMRGHRIEMSEIELTARSLEGVRDCTIVPVFNGNGDISRLALFYISNLFDIKSHIDSHDDPLAVRRQLLERLPAYMVPTIVRHIPRFPVTANGKLDRSVLERLAGNFGQVR